MILYVHGARQSRYLVDLLEQCLLLYYFSIVAHCTQRFLIHNFDYTSAAFDGKDLPPPQIIRMAPAVDVPTEPLPPLLPAPAP